MTVRIINRDQQVLGTLHLPANTRVVDLETLRRFGAHRVEIAR